MLLVERQCDGHEPIGLFDAAAREDEFAGHEPVALMAAAEQHLRYRLGAVDKDEGRGVPAV